MTPIDPPAPVAFIGLGVMGRAMAANLARAGFPLTVHTRSPARAEGLGARWAATPAEAARGARFVGLCMPDTPDVEAVLFGPDGVAEGAAPGTVVVDFSTIGAEATRGFAARLAAGGVTLLDGPVSGGPQGAIDGTLTCLLGGTADGVAAAMPALRAMARTITHLGPAGSGQVAKSANQMIITATMAGVAEALALGIRAGLDPRALREALSGGSADSAVLRNHALRWLDGRYAPGFRAELMLKDLRLAAEARAAAASPAPVADAVLPLMEAVVAAGEGAEDVVALMRRVAGLG